MAFKPNSTTTGTPRQDLSPYAVFNASAETMAAFKFLPIRTCDERTAMYPKFSAGAFSYKPPSSRRAPNAKFQQVDMTYDTGTVTLNEYSLVSPVDQVQANYQRSWFDPGALAVEQTAMMILRNYEEEVALALQGVSNTNAAGTVWSSSAATPIVNVGAAKQALRNRCGEPGPLQKLVLGLVPEAIDGAWRTTEVRSAISGGGVYGAYIEGSPMATRLAALAAILGVDEVVVLGAQFNNANSGQTPSLATVWTRTIGTLAYVDRNPSPTALISPGCGHSLVCNNAYNLNLQTLRMLPSTNDGLFPGDPIRAFEYEEPDQGSMMYGSMMHAAPLLAVSEAVQNITGILS